MTMTREQLLEHMARCVHAHCEMDEELLIAEMMVTYPARMVAMLSTAGKRRFTDHDFAMWCLQCAKRVQAGGAA